MWLVTGGGMCGILRRQLDYYGSAKEGCDEAGVGGEGYIN